MGKRLVQANAAELLEATHHQLRQLQHEVDMWKAQHAVLEAKNEALIADKIVVQSENGLLRDHVRALESGLAAGTSFFEPIVRDAPDEDPVHVVRSNGNLLAPHSRLEHAQAGSTLSLATCTSWHISYGRCDLVCGLLSISAPPAIDRSNAAYTMLEKAFLTCQALHGLARCVLSCQPEFSVSVPFHAGSAWIPLSNTAQVPQEIILALTWPVCPSNRLSLFKRQLYKVRTSVPIPISYPWFISSVQGL